MLNYQRYETKPIECWKKAEELRRSHRRHIFEAQAHGELLIHGMCYFHGMLNGMGDYAITEYTPYFRALMSDTKEAIRTHEIAEARGFGQDICSSMRCHLGALFQGFGLINKEGVRVKPDFIFQGLPCTTLAKTSQIYADYWGIPYFTMDIPSQDSPATMDYLVAELQEAIEWMEKITGREFDDERLLHGARNEWLGLSLFAQILDLCRTVPAPLDARHLFALQVPLVLIRQRDDVIQLYEEMLEETKERVRQGISARGYETCRLIHGGFPPMFYMGILRYPGQFGGVYVGGDLIHIYAAWNTLDLTNGDWVAAPSTPEEAGHTLRTREDALRMLADLYIRRRPHMCRVEAKAEEYVKLAQGWKADAFVIHIDRGCKNLQAGVLEAKLSLEEAGIPTLLYEGSGYDPRDLSESQVLDRFDAFMESLGLARIGEEGKGSGYGVVR
jgi:benzoyl-CoA reductase subunit B